MSVTHLQPGCPQAHCTSGFPFAPSHHVPQYLLSGRALQMQPGCAHCFVSFTSAMVSLRMMDALGAFV
ncbi:MAG: hypothetical protein M3O35_19840 [Acidobacteriota bacterium]|nr:hypothetical protein [Acidobacteriota bacterium]